MPRRHFRSRILNTFADLLDICTRSAAAIEAPLSARRPPAMTVSCSQQQPAQGRCEHLRVSRGLPLASQRPPRPCGHRGAGADVLVIWPASPSSSISRPVLARKRCTRLLSAARQGDKGAGGGAMSRCAAAGAKLMKDRRRQMAA